MRQPCSIGALKDVVVEPVAHTETLKRDYRLAQRICQHSVVSKLFANYIEQLYTDKRTRPVNMPVAPISLGRDPARSNAKSVRTALMPLEPQRHISVRLFY